MGEKVLLQRENKQEGMARLRPSETFGLRIVPVDALALHESHDPERTRTLAERLAADGLLANPPITIPWAGRFVVLDGATRVTAFRQMGWPAIVVQTTTVEDVDLHTWRHAVVGPSSEALLAQVQALEGVEADGSANGVDPDAVEQPVLAVLHLADERVYHLRLAQGMPGVDWLEAFNRLVAAYMAAGRVVRTLHLDLDIVRAQHPEMAGFFAFPRFQPEMILRMAVEGRTMPAGITRFIVRDRVLRLNVPLEILCSDQSIEEKNAWLDEYLRQKLETRQVRHYYEPVVLMDE